MVRLRAATLGEASVAGQQFGLCRGLWHHFLGAERFDCAAPVESSESRSVGELRALGNTRSVRDLPPGPVLGESWHCVGEVLGLRYYIGDEGALHWHYTSTALLVHCYSTGTSG